MLSQPNLKSMSTLQVDYQLEKKRDYAVYFFDPKTPKDVAEKASQLRKSEAKFDMHGGENETSSLLYLRPDLVKLDKSTSESGENQNRLQLSNDLYTAIWWYADYPNHYAGKAEVSSIELGKLLTDSIIESLANAIKAVKEDKQTLKLQDEYFSKVK